jgi:hypothetical protein
MAVTDKSSGLFKSRSKSPEQTAGIVVLDPGNHDDIAILAYRLWQQRGCPVGSDQEDWFRAEQALRNRTGVVAPSAA